jgi:hypothetical protein
VTRVVIVGSRGVRHNVRLSPDKRSSSTVAPITAARAWSRE